MRERVRLEAHMLSGSTYLKMLKLSKPLHRGLNLIAIAGDHGS
jgi:hypothetical protein